MHPTSLLCFILPVFSPLATGLSDFEIVTPIADHAVHVNETDDGRIVGGYETTISEYPHQISLRYRGHHRCGGSIISEEWIVTAAHCVDGTDSGMLSIKAGSSSLKGRDGQIRAVRRYLIHDDFSAVNLDGDIALIQLVTPLVFGSKVRPIELTWNDWAEGDAVVTGWGVTESSGGASSKLRAVKVPLISNRLCATLYKRRPITERMICAGYVGIGGRDACQGDSGGPMVMDDNLVGIVSWGIGCAKPHYPGVYTRVAAFRTWIQEETDI